MKNINSNINNYLNDLKKKYQQDKDKLVTQVTYPNLEAKVKSNITKRYNDIRSETKTQMDGVRDHYHFVEYLQYKYEKFKKVERTHDKRALGVIKPLLIKERKISKVLSKIFRSILF